MKNIIKRGTSLLLVLAMLLSFAAVVGAEEPTTTTSEKILTLTVEDAVVKAGETTYIPAYVQGSTDNIIMSMNLSAISENSAVQITGVYPAKPLRWDGDDWEYDESTKGVLTLSGATAAAPETKKPLLTWAVSKKKDGFTATAEKQLLCYIEVLATETTTAQVSLCAKPGAEESMFATYVEGAHVDSHSKNKVEFISGTAVVIPADATLPTVILTQSSFAAPTMATYDPEQGVDLLNYLKIVDKDGNLHDASSAADTSITGNYVSNGALKLMPTSGNSGNIIVNNLHAADDASITASATRTYTVTKDTVRTPWRAGFSTHNGKYKTQADFDADFANHPPKAPVYNGGAEHNSTSVYPNVFDQYGKVMEGYSFVPLVTLYNAADHTTPLANEAGNADPAYSAVHFNRNPTTGKWASDTLYYTKELKKDVWCKIELGVIDPDGEKANIPADTLEFLIQSQYPQAASATVVLGDMNGNEFPSGPVTTIDIPYGTTENKTFSIIVKEFRQADGKTMPEGTEPSATDVTIALDGTYTGVSISNDNKLVIDKTAQAGTVTVKATLNGKELGTLPLTLQKATSVVTELKLYDSATGKPKDGTEIEIKSGVTNGKAILPGIRANDELVLEFEPVCAIDQYGEIYQVEGKNFLRPSQYALYKQSSTNPEAYEICAAAERSVDAEGVVTATIKNSLDNDGTLLVQPGIYKFGTFDDNYNDNGFGNFDLNQKLMSDPFELVYGESEYTGTASYTGGAAGTTAPTVEVPYQYGTETKANTITVSADIKDQYNTTLVSDPYTYTLDEGSIKLNNKQIETGDITFDGESGLFTVNASAAKYFGDKTEIPLTATMTATYGTGENDKVDNIPISITLRKDASKLAHLKVTGTASDGTTGFTKEATILDKDETASYNLIVPNTGSRTYTITLSDVEDQYGTALTDRVSTSADVHSATYDNGILTINPQSAGGKAVLTLTESGTTTGHKVELTLNFAQMSFVNSDGADYKVDMWMNTNERTYGQDGKRTWAEVCTKWGVAAYPDVHIRTEDGKAGEKVTDKVKVVVKQNGEEVYDSFKTYTEAPKANAGDYTIELIYVKQEGAEAKKTEYPIDSTPFKITPKEVTIKVTGGTITKEYDGTQSLVLPSSVTLTIEGNPADLTVDPNALQYASENAGTGIKIELVPGKTCLTGAAAANYNVSLDGLTGTITPRKLIVTPKAETFEYGENDKITTALTTEFDYAGKNGDLPSGLTPSFTGSMKLQQNNADVTEYNAGAYNVVNDDLSAGTNYEIEFPATSVQWTINRKLLTKVKNSGLPQSMFGTNTDKGCISSVLESLVIGEDVAWKVSDFVDASALSFPSNTVYVTGQNGTQYPAPGPYMLNVTKPKKDIGKNYRVDETTVYEFDYTVNKLDASLLTVTLTGDTYTYNGMEQGPTVSVTYTNQANDTLDLTSRCTIGGTTKATDAGTYTITVTSDLVSGSKTVTWKIDPKMITAGMFTQKSHHPVYDGTEQTLTGSVLDGKDSGITVNGENKVLKLGTDFTAAEVKQTNAGEYTMTVTGQGNYTGTANVKVKIDKYEGRVYTEIDKLQNTTVEVTRGQSVEYEILTDVVLHEQELVATLGNEKIGKIGYQIHGAGGNMAGIENPRIEVTGDKKLLFKATVTNQVEVGREFHITFENSLDNENIKSRLVLTISFVVTEKPEQKDFRIVEGSEGTYSYSQGGLQLTTTGSATGSTVTWSSSNTEFATVDNNGKVTFVKPTTTAGVIITATASETSAPNALFKATERTYRLTITKGQVTITASSATMTANDPLPGFSATASGLNPNDSVSEVFQTLTASVSTDGKTAGTFRVTPNAVFKTGVKDWNEYYELSFVQGTLTVNPAQTAIDVVLPIIIGGNTCANGYANSACESFYDLDASRWYHEAIDWAYSLGLMNGTTKSTFGPNAAATRAQTWTMLARIAGQDTRRSSTWYEVGQKWAMNLGITDGTNPMGSLTREQLAAMLYRYVGSPAVNGTLTFTDSANVSTWARNAMIWAVQNGILDGVGGNRLNPKGTTTRAQAAAIFMRFSKLINK